jgi:ubiquinone/menaquinone biosynthesis C-methylase UbiE
MSLAADILMRAFGRPQGVLGRLGGAIMARMNRDIAASVIAQLQLRPDEKVLEIGFGPGVGIALLASAVPRGLVAGIDPSPGMCAQAGIRNEAAIAAGLVELRQGSVEALSFGDAAFDAYMTVNSMQVWPDKAAGLQEIGRVLRAGGRIALGFTIHSGQRRDEIMPTLSVAGFVEPRLVDVAAGFCALATKP